MKFCRASGILFHPTSLPGEFGIGELGSQAIAWVDFLVDAGVKYWQVLPLNPTGYADSPYQAFSAFAGNPYLISLENLVEDGYLKNVDLNDRPDFPVEKVDFGALIPWKLKLLDQAYKRYKKNKKADCAAFVDENSNWLPDFALFMAIKEHFGGGSWVDWPEAYKTRHPETLAEFSNEHKDEIERQCFWQFLFYKQWLKLRAYANQKGIRIIGDIPIYVAHDSSDVWMHKELFSVDDLGHLELKSGVPPDDFSDEGQLWGNPLFKWEKHKETGYAWWKERLEQTLKIIDILRIDHFRGFAGYWEIPGDSNTAKNGMWVPGPGKDFFSTIQQDMGELPLIAEDLGVITPDVIELRDAFDLPGMKILQFAFDENPDHPFLPHMYPENCVAYTGTHDNETARSRFENDEKAKRFMQAYFHVQDPVNAWQFDRPVMGIKSRYRMCPDAGYPQPG